MTFDFCVIGGGIVGLATAYRLLERHPGASLVLVEKEHRLATHQTGHNSGVVHAGVYYAPGSLKARLCRAGAEATRAFCDRHDIPHETRGKLIVAVKESERARMNALLENARANGLSIRPITADELREREPALNGIAALHVPSSGIVDYPQMARVLGHEIARMGGEIHLNAPVTRITESASMVGIDAGPRQIAARHVVICAGLQADRLVRLSGLRPDFAILPFRGEYYSTSPEKARAFHHLIYPVPDPALPFLGVHFTPTTGGSMTIGPNAVLGFAREGYAKFSIHRPDIAANLAFPGMWRLAARHWRFGVEELRDSLVPRAYLEKCRRYWPDLSLDDLRPWPAGIRAQAVTRKGEMIQDFHFLQTARMLHVCNAPSPAATSALPIGAMIADKIEHMRNSDGR